MRKLALRENVFGEVEQFRRSEQDWLRYPDYQEFVMSMQELAQSLVKFLTPEVVLRDMPPEERVKGLSLEERLKGLSPEEIERLRQLLSR